MLIYPAIDLIDGNCVRLAQGRFDQVSEYDNDPARRLQQFVSAGASTVHIVDLDGARCGQPVQHELIASLARQGDVEIQAAGGVREERHVQTLLDAGVKRIVIGSLAVLDPELVRAWLQRFGAASLTLSLDVNIKDQQPIIATHGWAQSSGESLWDILDYYAEDGLEHVLVTDVSRDGMMTGPNEALMQEITSTYPAIMLQASGGVGTLQHISALRETSASAAIVGRALYEGNFTLEEAINAGA